MTNISLAKLFLGAALLIAPNLALAGDDLSGLWEVQSLGADRQVIIEQQGDRLIAHRVMWPEFEGERYKLEHLFRGKISSTNISGDLLVKEPELKDYEVLRKFTGTITAGNKLTLDGLPLSRSATEKKQPAIESQIEKAQVVAETQTKPPATQKAPPTIAEAKTKPTANPSASAAAPSLQTENSDKEVDLFSSIMGAPGASELFTVSAKIEIPDEAAKHAQEGDRLFDSGDFAGALAKFQAASEIAGGQQVSLLHRMGRCQLKLKDYDSAVNFLRKAMRLDPNNKKIQRDYKSAKRRCKKSA